MQIPSLMSLSIDIKAAVKDDSSVTIRGIILCRIKVHPAAAVSTIVHPNDSSVKTEIGIKNICHGNGHFRS